MPTYPFMQIDAFSDRPLGGNPCAVVFEADDLDEETMLAVAREMNLAETAFVSRSRAADFAARYFTPAREIPFAGHPTVATAFGLAVSGRLPLEGDHCTLTLELREGPIPVELFVSGGAVERIVMTQRKPAFLETHPAAQVLPLFGLPAGAALHGAPIQTVSTGTPQLMVPLASHEALRQARLAIPAFVAFREQAGFFSPHLFCLGGATPAGDTFARHLDAPPDLPEDPFTGSATGGMAAYLWRYNLLAIPEFVAEQGHWMGRPGQATVKVIGPREDIETVQVGGAAVLVVGGQLHL